MGKKHDKGTVIRDFAAFCNENGIDIDTARAMAMDAEFDMDKDYDDRLFEQYLNQTYGNLCKKMDKDLVDGEIFKKINDYLSKLQ